MSERYCRTDIDTKRLYQKIDTVFSTSGTDGVRTHDLSRVRRTLIPAELPFHIPPVSSSSRLALQTGKQSRKNFVYRKKGIFRSPFSVRKMGLEPTRCSQHKILSLARLPIPTLPHIFLPTKGILPQRKSFVND